MASLEVLRLDARGMYAIIREDKTFCKKKNPSDKDRSADIHRSHNCISENKKGNTHTHQLIF